MSDLPTHNLATYHESLINETLKLFSKEVKSTRVNANDDSSPYEDKSYESSHASDSPRNPERIRLSLLKELQEKLHEDEVMTQIY